LSTPTKYPLTKTSKRIWHTPRSRFAWFWFSFSLICCVTLYVLDTFDVVSEFSRISHGGIPAYIMILMGAAYSLRTRFMRNLPGKAQNWLWMHMWIGIGALIVAGLHDGFLFLPIFSYTESHLGMLALYSLILIVGSGIAGRLLDRWQARVIVQEANTNGVGIAGTVSSRLLELEYIVERLYAGKSEVFKQYCAQAIRSADEPLRNLPKIMPQEQADFQRAYTTLHDHARLKRSLMKQEHARRIFRGWRTGHTALAPLALLIITYHALTQLMTTMFHLLIPWLP